MNTKLNEFYEYFSGIKDNSEDIKLQKELKSECNRFTLIAKKYLFDCKRIYSELNSKVVRNEYSSGGELLPMGYYCPSPIYDIVTANCKRGKILKKLTTRSKPTYEYCFDKNGKLIIVNHLYENCSEILKYDDNVVTGITFSKEENIEITSVIECKYDDNKRILSFIRAASSYHDCCMDQLEKEYYVYNEMGLYKAEVFDYLDNEQSGILNYYRYSFEHDNNGYLKEYKVETSTFENDIYNILVKRKV